MLHILIKNYARENIINILLEIRKHTFYNQKQNLWLKVSKFNGISLNLSAFILLFFLILCNKINDVNFLYT